MAVLTRRHALGALLAAGVSSIPLTFAYAQIQKSDGKPAAGDYMGQALRRKVTALKADVAKQPTDAATYAARGDVLYDWMNAFALTGVYLHPDLPSIIAGLYSPAFANNGERSRTNSFRSIDQYVRTLDALEQNPKLCGAVTAKTDGRWLVDSHVQFEQTYTVGDAPLQAGGGVVLPNHFYFASEELQTSDPKADNYVSARSSNPAVRIVADVYPIAGMFSSRLGVSEAPRVFFKISEGALKRGDTVTVTYGDRSGGSRGLRLIHVSNSALRFPFWVLTGTDGLLLTPREAELPVYGGPVSGVHGFGPAIVGAGETFTLSLRAEDKFRNLATGGAPAWSLMLDGKPFREVAASAQSIAWLKDMRLTKPGVYRFEIRSVDGRIAGRCDPILVEAKPEERIYWGETHGHCGFSEGMGKVDDYFLFARDEARLDFVTLSEHDLWLDASEWEAMRRGVRKFDKPGQFITFMGYEWTVVSAYGGHHNVIFRNIDTVQPVTCQRHPTLPDLYAGLRKAYKPTDVMVIPHAHMTADAMQNDPALEPLVEIVSEHGTFEWMGRRYLANGFQLGFVGAGDDHIGHPGYKPLPQGRYYFDGPGGLAAVYAPSKTRGAIFDAMKSRHTYATNSTRIILKARLNGQHMGEIAPLKPERVIEGVAHGTGAIESITLVKNGREHEILAFDAPTASAADDIVEVRFESTSDPGAALTPSRSERTWSGKIVVEGGALAAVSSPQMEALNVLTEWVKLNPADPREASFRFITRGSAKAIRLRLTGDPVGARIRVQLPEARNPLDAATNVPAAGAPAAVIDAKDDDPGGERTSAGSFIDKIWVRRIRPASELDRTFRFVDGEPPKVGDNYYVRVTQADGGQAWSSPAWIGAVRKNALP